MTNDREYTDNDSASGLPAPPLVQHPLLHCSIFFKYLKIYKKLFGNLE